MLRRFSFLFLVSWYIFAVVFAQAAPTPWLGSPEGLQPALPLGWPPVNAEGAHVQVVAREYRFDNGPFLSGIVAKEAEILAGPIEAIVSSAEGEQKLVGAPAQIKSTSPAKVTLHANAAAGPVAIDSASTVELDGMIRTDFTLASPTGATIDNFTLRIPLRAQYAKYLYHYPGQWGSVRNAGALPAQGWSHAFKPFVWLGDETRGLGWFAESDQNWTPLDNPQAITITRHGNIVMLELHVIAAPRSLRQPLRFTFGFQATPVKAPTRDVWDYRICHEGNYGIETTLYRPPARVMYPAAGNIDLRQGTVEMWIRPTFDPNLPVPHGDRGLLNQELFSLQLPHNYTIGYYWNVDDHGMRLYIQHRSQYPVLIGERSFWRKGDAHHVAFTWGKELCLYVDGKPAVRVPYQGPLAPALDKGNIMLGGTHAQFIIEELRISSVQRTSFPPTRQFARDKYTLLLDHFNQVNTKVRTIQPIKGRPGRLSAHVAAVDNGQSLQLSRPGPDVTYLDRLAELGVRTIVFHEQWSDIQNFPDFKKHGQQLQSLVTACHERGMKLLLYFGYEMSNTAPTYKDFADECLVAPRTGGYTRKPDQTAYPVCYRSHWQDFLAQSIAQMMDIYDIDGVYLDGTANPGACTNGRHGCGYESINGDRRPTYPIFAVRRLMQRIYNIVTTRKPDGLVNVHQSTVMTIPTLAFATSYWDGEQLGSVSRVMGALESLPLDSFRTEFMGRQWGIPAELLCYGQPYTYPQALAISLPHDVLVRGTGWDNLELESSLWRAMDSFGRQEAKWQPYWANADLVQATPASIKVSLYNRGAKGVMLVVSNLGNSAVEAAVTLNTKALGLPNKTMATDVLSGKSLFWTGNKLHIQMEPLTFRLVLVK
jgi:hypothetical protein